MIIIATASEARILPNAWDYPIDELDYLMESDSSNGIYVLKDNRLYEAELIDKQVPAIVRTR